MALFQPWAFTGETLCYFGGVSHVRRLRLTDRIFFLSVNLRAKIQPFGHSEYPLLIEALEASRRRLKFLLCGYVLMLDHWHALVWPQYPLLISEVLHDVKKVSAGKFHARRGSRNAFWQHQFWDRFVRDEKEFTLAQPLLAVRAPDIPGLGIPSYDWWNEALYGVACSAYASVFPHAPGMAAACESDF